MLKNKAEHIFCLPFFGAAVAIIAGLVGVGTSDELALREHKVTYENSRGQRYTRTETNAAGPSLFLLFGLAVLFFSAEAYLKIFDYLLGTPVVFLLAICIVGFCTIFNRKQFLPITDTLKRIESGLHYLSGIVAAAAPYYFLELGVWHAELLILFIYGMLILLLWLGLTLPVAMSCFAVCLYYFRLPSFKARFMTPLNLVWVVSFVIAGYLYAPEIVAPYLEPFWPIYELLLDTYYDVIDAIKRFNARHS